MDYKKIPRKIRRKYYEYRDNKQSQRIEKQKPKIKNLLHEIIGFEPESKTVDYYCQRIRKKEFTLKKLPLILNPQNSPLYRKEKDDFNINFFERRFFSQYGEDGIIDFIFSIIGTTNKFFVEFGVGDGTECNTRYLLEKKGWTGLMMDGGDDLKPHIKKEMITAENINDLFKKYNVPKHFDLLSIDIDLNTYWVWKAIEDYFPKVVVIEYNSSIPPTESRATKYDPLGMWDGTNYFGASLLALVKLGELKGYTLVGCESHGVNAFFINDDLLDNKTKNKKIQGLYRPPKYGEMINGTYIGHPKSERIMREI